MAPSSTPTTRLGREDAWRIGILVVSVTFVSALHYLTNPAHVVWHEVFQRLYYVPIVLGAYWYGVPGGLLVAMAASTAYVPHIRTAWVAGVQQQASRYAELVVFNLVGLIVGMLSSAQRRVARQYQRAATSLEAANRELRDSYDQLRQADRLKALGEIAAGLAHEIRHPLASIGGALEIIANRAAAGSPEAEFSALARTELDRLDRLVSEFLRYARPREPEWSDVSMSDVAGRVVALTRAEADRVGVAIDLETPGTETIARVDPQQIQQVLLNLVINAIQASPPGGRVAVRVAIDGDDVRVDVRDQGPGVTAEDLPRIFTPFFTTKARGTGLGLAIAYRIVTAHGGTIEAIREPANAGGWFRVSLQSGRRAGRTGASREADAVRSG